MQKAAAVYSRCPSCMRNFFNVFCETTCSSSQSEFIEVIASKTNANGKFDEVPHFSFLQMRNWGASYMRVLLTFTSGKTIKSQKLGDFHCRIESHWW